MKVAIVGAGPRGILALSALINQYKYNTNKEKPLDIGLFDTTGIGGQVWKKDQWAGLIMNTPADEVTLYTDASVTLSSPIFDGPSLFEWAASPVAQQYLVAQKYSEELQHLAAQLGPKDYAPRVLYGAYINWFYDDLLAQLPYEVTVNFYQEKIIGLQRYKNNDFRISSADHHYTVNSLIVSLGQMPNYLNEAEQQLALFADEKKLFYLPPISPAEADLSKLPATENVILRGLGLSFFDYISELTLGRGGHYMKNSDGSLSYQPSGREPHIIAGSKRGLPFYPKAVSQKGYGERYQPNFLTVANIQQHLVNGKLPYDSFLQMLKSDIELVYYMLLIDNRYPTKSASEFKKRFIAGEDRNQLIAAFKFDPADIWDWHFTLNPLGTPAAISTTEYQNEVINWVDAMTADANLGSKTGPVTSSLELLRDFRDIIRDLVNQQLFDDNEYVNQFLQEFNSMNNFLSVGAPALRTAQLSALMRSGIVTVMAPDMDITTVEDHFVAQSAKTNDKFQSDYVIEARMPKPNLSMTANPLLEDMLATSTIKPASVIKDGQPFALPAVQVIPASDQVMAGTGQVLPNLFIWGLQLEGLRWSTTISSRPGVNDFNLQTADYIAARLLHLNPADNVNML